MIINRQNIPNISHEGLRFNKRSEIVNCYDWSDDNYFLFEFITTRLITDEILKSVFNPTLIQYIKLGKIKLILCNKHESIHYVIEDCYKIFCLDFNLDPNNIIFISASNTIYETVRVIAKKYNLPEFKTAVYRWAEKTFAYIEHYGTTSEPYNKIGKTFDKKYLFLNRRWRPQRPAMVGLLKVGGLLDHGYVSLRPVELGNWSNSYDYVAQFITDTEFLDIWKSNKDEIISIPNLIVDTDKFEMSSSIYLNPELKYFYANTYFSIVSETSFFENSPDQNKVQFSEKTIKEITQRQPFIIMNSCDSLKFLREYGYKTFHPWIDESYDQEPDDGKRLIKIKDEVKRLCELNHAQLQEFLTETEKICEHNYQTLITDWNKKGRYIKFYN